MTEPVPIERAYVEACQALGEAIVIQRLLNAELARLHALTDEKATSS